ncbi:type 4a pilus biogenesis protein PilO [Deinococcus sp.]|uniref:type 4a pilus biogenesis protein PilO n=1 Tax=Deinococcus sp. TaxID=47478 RepID=UPI003B591F64
MSAKLPTFKPRDLFFIVLAICLLALLLWYFTRFQVRQQQIQELQSQLELSDTQLATLQSQQAQLPGLRADVQKLEVEQDVFTKALPDTVKMGQIISDVQDSVLAADGSMDGVTSSASSEANLPAGVKAVNLNVSLQGRFAPIFRSLRSIETLGRFSKITGVNMTLPAPNAADPKLSSTINMTVYTFDPSQAQPAAPTTPGDAPAAPGAPAPATGGNS